MVTITRRMAARSAALGLACLLGAAPSVEASPILVGTPGPGAITDENCIPFGCPELFGLGFYQQVYSSTAFSGPTTINSIAFFDTFSALPPDSNALTPATYTLRLSTTGAAVGALSTTLGDNVGLDDTLFFTGALGGPIGGPKVVIVGTPFAYNPAAGNLLLQIEMTSIGLESFVQMDSDFGNGLFSRSFANAFAEPLLFQADNSGLVTEFNSAAVPEPATLLLLGGGLAGLARARRRRSVSGN